ncbi:hypothetical protein EDC65_3856 [Stella humosa]|uniref:DUF1513 domain-containing protein n=1 Tax=Stella humosa TaxID=94 RepID=A0A3N1KYK3_9PROT|nr:DUF1513 domain-containing protein [Stella humosa]ROP84502.1 hypothetical protein EDC65_3856 [Stella humosa]BBK34022.1 Tat pathway signal protein [Stella humosa]
MRRRDLLAGGLACAALAALPRARAEAARPLMLGARIEAGGRFFASAFDGEGEGRLDLALPARGHGFAQRPGGAEVVACARRPGRYLAVIDLAAGGIRHMVANAEGRRFNGHGAFSTDGRLFFASESDYAGERGVIGVYAADRGYAPVAVWDSGGLDPHDVRLLPDGRTLVVANGGIVTDLDAPRMKLNTGAMDSTLAYLDTADGRLVAVHRPAAELGALGIRHLAVAADGMVAVAAQYEGPAVDLVPLVGTHRPGDREIRFFAAPQPTLRAMRQYCGSAAMDAAGRVLGVSSPRGNIATFWDIADGRVLSSVAVADGCGIAGAGPDGGFVVASGLGGAVGFDPATGAGRPLAGSVAAAGRWDNHLIALQGGT